MGSIASIVDHLVLHVSQHSHALFKIAHRAHPLLRAMLVDITCYRPKLVTTSSIVPESFRWDESPDWYSVAEDLLEEEEASEQVTPAI